MRLQGETCAGALAPERDGQQDERRLEANFGLVGPRPDQKAQRHKQRVRAPFLQGAAGAPEQFHQPHFQFLFLQPDKHLAPPQRFCSVRAAQVFQAARLVQCLAARVLAVHQLGAGQQFEGAAFGHRVFQRRCGHLQQQRLLALLEVQQRIAQRQVQQLSLPARQPVLGVEFSGWHLGRRAGRGVWQVGRFFDGEGVFPSLGQWLRVGAGLRQCQRPDARHAGAPDVHQPLELRILGALQLAVALGNRLAEAHRLALRCQGGFKHQHFLQLQALAHGRGVVHHGGVKGFLVQPHPDKGMAPGEDQHRVQVRLLQAGGKQQRQVQAGGQPRVQHLAGAAHLLAGVLETGRRQRVVQLFLQHGAPQGRCQLPHALGALPVAIDGAGLARRLQHQRRAFQQPVHRRVVGLHKSRHHGRHLAQAAPLVARQQFHGAVVRCQQGGGLVWCQAAVQLKMQHGRFGLRQA